MLGVNVYVYIRNMHVPGGEFHPFDVHKLDPPK